MRFIKNMWRVLQIILAVYTVVKEEETLPCLTLLVQSQKMHTVPSLGLLPQVSGVE